MDFKRGLFTSCSHLSEYELDCFRMKLNWKVFSESILKVHQLQTGTEPLGYRTSLN